ncbi:hypothetical protein GOV06_02810 [Candidatus Woesearchaeota archaeon]|nr:hypothetical protein [Candidatus Woesearchaeota archaeon]
MQAITKQYELTPIPNPGKDYESGNSKFNYVAMLDKPYQGRAVIDNPAVQEKEKPRVQYNSSERIIDLPQMSHKKNDNLSERILSLPQMFYKQSA